VTSYNVKFSDNFWSIVKSIPDTPLREVDHAIKTLEEEGYVVFDIVPYLARLLHRKDFTNFAGYQCEFNILHGLGHYDDLAPWMYHNGVDLFPLGTWKRETMHVGSDYSVYLSDAEGIMVWLVPGGLEVIELLITGFDKKCIIAVPPALDEID